MQARKQEQAYFPVQPIADREMESRLKALSMKSARAFLRGAKAEECFLSSYRDWLFSSPQWQIKGLEAFKPYMSCGITQSFHDFYQIHHGKILTVCKGEYPYHKSFCQNTGRPWKQAEDGLETGCCLILSWPFAGDGSARIKSDLLEECSAKSIPVLLDCAYWALSAACFLDLKDYPCIAMISFSASKFFNLGRLRVGMSFSKYEDKGSMALLAPYRYTNRWGAYPVLELLKSFPVDYMMKKYSPRQKEICRQRGLKPSDTMLFGLGGKEGEALSKDGSFNRFCLSAFFTGL